MPPVFRLRAATADDVPLILSLIRELAEFERLSHEVVTDEAGLRAQLFGPHPRAEVLLAENTAADHDAPAGFALFFHNFSTFVGKPGIYLEDLYVRPAFRGRGLGRALLTRLAQIAVERDCGRFEWAVLDWNENAIGFYKKLGARVLDDWRICRVTGEALRTLAAAVPNQSASS
ncbi:MAG: GNAT family N-acetyltransferase [Verrucomicrobia bacterium]|nr:GNAT family N-acetyltransferase [Verrucomicrobiota bacterium]